ncbi:hypothetical protein GCM10010320_79140 [Streptomyces caelestis]|uniref:Uncharacterized protein n=1 Tax=Streptomyces caelestis TaxID=36816 RepID=A0A7W9GZ40_9ACTN|nr:hypothetical protein [Streptomyces caelestis]GGW85515.1 hypothetical protein GCM10010320_79140 [Streptomyces caelestis]
MGGVPLNCCPESDPPECPGGSNAPAVFDTGRRGCFLGRDGGGPPAAGVAESYEAVGVLPDRDPALAATDCLDAEAAAAGEAREARSVTQGNKIGHRLYLEQLSVEKAELTARLGQFPHLSAGRSRRSQGATRGHPGSLLPGNTPKRVWRASHPPIGYVEVTGYRR